MSLIRSAAMFTIGSLAAAPLAACRDGADVPAPALSASSWPGDRLLGRWEPAEAVLPPTTLQVRRAGADGRTVTTVSLSGVRYDATTTGDDSSLVIHGGSQPTIRGVLVADGTRLRVEFLDALGTPQFTQQLVRAP